MSADNELHCNNLRCRKMLSTEGRAVVTNCSHIFCLTCANQLFGAAKVCPACETQLTEADDIVVCSLNPTTDYKSSILAGLAPSIILEVATRAMSFWTYQTSQESAFQSMVLKNAQDRLIALERNLKSGEEEIAAAREKITSLTRDLDYSTKKNHGLIEAAREKERQYSKLRDHFDMLKRKQDLSSAAQHVVNDVLNQSVQRNIDYGYVSNGENMSNRGQNMYGGEPNQQRQPSIHSTPSHRPQSFHPSPQAPISAPFDNRRLSADFGHGVGTGHCGTMEAPQSRKPLHNLDQYTSRLASNSTSPFNNATGGGNQFGESLANGGPRKDTGIRSHSTASRKFTF